MSTDPDDNAGAFVAVQLPPLRRCNEDGSLEPAREMTEDDAAFMASFDLHQPRVLSVICQAIKIDLTTEQYTIGRDRWHATPSDAPCFSGSLIEVAAYVRGYGTARYKGRLRIKELLQRLACELRAEADKT